MRRTFRRNRIFERQSSQNRHSGLKFSSKRKNRAFSMKIVQNAIFRSCTARFGEIAFLSVKVLKIVTLAWNSRQNIKTVSFPWKFYQLSFQVMRSTFWPNRIFERQSFQRRHTSLKVCSKRKKGGFTMKTVQNALFRSCAARFGQIGFVSVKVFKIVKLAWNALQTGKTVHLPWKLYKTISPKRENSALVIEIVQSAFFRSCAARFGQIAFFSVNVFKDVTLASRSLQNGKMVRFPWKLYKTLFSGYAQHVLAKSHLWASKFWKSWNWPEMLFKPEKQCALHENCTKRSFHVTRSTFWPNRIFERQSSQNCETGLKRSSNRENSASSMKIVETPLFRSCGARFGQIAFFERQSC